MSFVTIPLKLNTQYITQDTALMAELQSILERSEYQNIVIQAPQGLGKTRLFSNEIFQSSNIITPTRVTTDQQASDYGYEVRVCGRDWNKGRGEDFANWYNQRYIATMASSNVLPLNGDYLIFDECHKLIDYSTFAISSTYKMLNTLDYARQLGKKIIFVSATPEKLLFYSELMDEVNGEPKIPIDIVIDIQPSEPPQYINDLYIYQYDEVHFSRRIRAEVKERAANGRQVALLRSTSHVSDFTDELNNRGISAVGFSSKNRTSNAAFDKLAEQGIFDTQVLNATSLIDCGINIYNEDVTDLYNAFPFDLTMHKQFMARARNAKPNYHILQARLDSTEQQTADLSPAELYERGRRKFISIYATAQSDKDFENLVGVVEGEQGYEFSPLAMTCEIIKLKDKAALSTAEGIRAAVGGYVMGNVYPSNPSTAAVRGEKARAKTAQKTATEQVTAEVAAELDEYARSGEPMPKFKRDTIVEKLNAVSKKQYLQHNRILQNFAIPYTLTDKAKKGSFYTVTRNPHGNEGAENETKS